MSVSFFSMAKKTAFIAFMTLAVLNFIIGFLFALTMVYVRIHNFISYEWIR